MSTFLTFTWLVFGVGDGAILTMAMGGGSRSSERQSSVQGPSPSPVDNIQMNFNKTPQTTVLPHQDGTPTAGFPEAKSAQVAADNRTLTQFMKPKFARAPIKEAGRVAYLGRA